MLMMPRTKARGKQKHLKTLFARLFGNWIATKFDLFHGSPQSPLIHCIFWEPSHSCCPSQSIFPSSAVQTLLSLFGNRGWRCCAIANGGIFNFRYCDGNYIPLRFQEVLFTDSILSHPWFTFIMNRDRFLQILYYLHLTDSQNNTWNNKLFKLRPVLDYVVRQCKKHYYRRREVSIDDWMIGTKRKIGFGWYLPLKPTKWGKKVWVMADAVTGYCCNLQIYTGREGNHAEKGLANRVVKDVMIDYQGLGHRINVDIFYTSPKLFKDL